MNKLYNYKFPELKTKGTGQLYADKEWCEGWLNAVDSGTNPGLTIYFTKKLKEINRLLDKLAK